MSRIPPRIQGGLGEMSAWQWFISAGYDVFTPIMHSPDIDLIAVSATERLTVEVKSSTFFHKNRWSVMLATAGGNQSWTGVIKLWRADRCDRLFVTVGDGRRWLIPSTAIEAERAIALGGPKYSEFEVEPGRPLVAPPKAAPLSSPAAPAG